MTDAERKVVDEACLRLLYPDYNGDGGIEPWADTIQPSTDPAFIGPLAEALRARGVFYEATNLPSCGGGPVRVRLFRELAGSGFAGEVTYADADSLQTALAIAAARAVEEEKHG